VTLPFEQISYDMKTHAVIRDVLDRNQDGISDRIITYEGFGGARTEETDTDFDGRVDRWETFGSEGQRMRSATASNGTRPDRVATYDRAGTLSRVEADTDLDGRFEPHIAHRQHRRSGAADPAARCGKGLGELLDADHFAASGAGGTKAPGRGIAVMQAVSSASACVSSAASMKR